MKILFQLFESLSILNIEYTIAIARLDLHSDFELVAYFFKSLQDYLLFKRHKAYDEKSKSRKFE